MRIGGYPESLQAYLPETVRDYLKQREAVLTSLLDPSIVGSTLTAQIAAPDLPLTVAEVLKTAGTQLQPGETLEAKYFYRRGRYYATRFELVFSNPEPEAIQKVSLVTEYAYFGLGHAELSFRGMDIRSFNGRGRLILPNLIGYASQNEQQNDASQRAMVLYDMMHETDNQLEWFQLAFLRELTGIFTARYPVPQ